MQRKEYDWDDLWFAGLMGGVATLCAAFALLFAINAITPHSGDIQEVNGKQYVEVEDLWYEYNDNEPATFKMVVDNAG